MNTPLLFKDVWLQQLVERRRRQNQRPNQDYGENRLPPVHIDAVSYTLTIPAFAGTVEHNRQNPITLTARLVLPDIRRGQRASQERSQ